MKSGRVRGRRAARKEIATLLQALSTKPHPKGTRPVSVAAGFPVNLYATFRPSYVPEWMEVLAWTISKIDWVVRITRIPLYSES